MKLEVLRRRAALGLGALGCLAGALPAQSLPAFHPVNPVAEARSGLYFQPYVEPGPRWGSSVTLDYGSMVELGFRTSLSDTAMLLDAEVLRLGLGVTRNLDDRHFVTAEGWVGGSYGGFLDGFLNWYHGLFGIRFPERENRPHDSFAYRYETPGGRTIRFDRSPFYLGDIRLGIGRRHDASSQSVLSLTLPTNTAGAGYARGVPSLSLLNTFRTMSTPRLLLEGSVNAGYTPKHGVLSPIQQRLFFSGSAGFQWRTVGQLWSFGNIYLHSPDYAGAELRSLDNWELDVDFGWVVRSRGGREFRFGMTEDLRPSGPAIDAIFRLGYTW